MVSMETALSLAAYTGVVWGLGCLSTWLAVDRKRRAIDRELASHRRMLEALTASTGATHNALEEHVNRFQEYVDADLKLDDCNARLRDNCSEAFNVQNIRLTVLDERLKAVEWALAEKSGEGGANE